MGNIDLIFKIAGVGLLTAVLHSVLKEYKKEDYAILTTLGGITVVLFWVVQLLGGLFDQVKSVFKLY